MVMPMNFMGMGMYGMFGMNTFDAQGGNIYENVRYRYGFDKDFKNRPEVAGLALDVTPIRPEVKIPVSYWSNFKHLLKAEQINVLLTSCQYLCYYIPVTNNRSIEYG